MGTTGLGTTLAQQSPDRLAASPSVGGLGTTNKRLDFLFQTTRPQHISGHPDKLPFESAEMTRNVFQQFQLPLMYIQVSDGAPGLSSSTTHRDESGRYATKFEFVVHHVSKQGDWSIALSHIAATGVTSAFWSTGRTIDSQALLEDVLTMKRYAVHPMLLPCIMLATSLAHGVERRKGIKSKLSALESSIRRISIQCSKTSLEGPNASDSAFTELSHSIEGLFELLNACRKVQASQEGRKYFWKAFHADLQDGFSYVDELARDGSNASLRPAQVDLRQWTSLNWAKMESLHARDIDYVSRVNNISDTLFQLVNQRDSRVQLAIAQASQHDSEDMKFIALLGSVFLPASLVASIFGVQEFQFARPAPLFGAYIGISIPLIGLVVALCLARRHITPLWSPKKRAMCFSGSQTDS